MVFTDDMFLYERLKNGDSKAYDYIMETYYKTLCVYACSLTHDRDTAEDIVQNVMVKIWAKRKKITFNSSLKNYLYRSVYNEFIAQFRKKERLTFLEKKHIEALETLILDDSVDIDALVRLVEKEIDKLPPKCKEVFLLNKKEGLTHTEISEYLHISIKTIEGHMTRAFNILNEKLGNKIRPILFLIFRMKGRIRSNGI